MKAIILTDDEIDALKTAIGIAVRLTRTPPVTESDRVLRLGLTKVIVKLEVAPIRTMIGIASGAVLQLDAIVKDRTELPAINWHLKNDDFHAYATIEYILLPADVQRINEVVNRLPEIKQVES